MSSPSASPSITFDLKSLVEAHGGIPSDTRELMLMALQHLHAPVAGLVFPRQSIGHLAPLAGRLDAQSLQLHNAREGTRSARLFNRVGRGWRPDLGDRLARGTDLIAAHLAPRRLKAEPVHPTLNRGLFEWLMRPDLGLEHAQAFDRVQYRLVNRTWGSINSAAAWNLLGRRSFDLRLAPGEKLFLSSPVWIRPSAGQTFYVRWHDAINLLSIGWERAYDAQVFSATMRMLVAAGARFVCNSATSRRDLISFFPETEARSDVVYCPVRPVAHETDERLAEAILESHGLAGVRYVVTVSSASPRKNFEGILEIFDRLSHRQPDLRLVVIGKPFRLSSALRRSLRRLKAAGKLVTIEGVGRMPLATVVRHAAAYLSASVHEGFGKGLIEAQSLGVPVVAPRTPIFEELVGGSAALFSGFDYAEAVSELEAILANPSRRETLGEAGRRNALRFEPAALVADFARALDITP